MTHKHNELHLHCYIAENDKSQYTGQRKGTKSHSEPTWVTLVITQRPLWLIHPSSITLLLFVHRCDAQWKMSWQDVSFIAQMFTLKHHQHISQKEYSFCSVYVFYMHRQNTMSVVFRLEPHWEDAVHLTATCNYHILIGRKGWQASAGVHHRQPGHWSLLRESKLLFLKYDSTSLAPQNITLLIDQ